jgi:hypothetical protein
MAAAGKQTPRALGPSWQALDEADPLARGWLGRPRMLHHRLLVPASG